MDIQEYQERALATAAYGEGDKIIYPVLGLNGEAGEVAEKVKKVLRDKGGKFGPEERIEILKEIGDVLWYCNALANDLDSSLEEIMEMNILKLESRRSRRVISGSGDNR